MMRRRTDADSTPISQLTCPGPKLVTTIAHRPRGEVVVAKDGVPGEHIDQLLARRDRVFSRGLPRLFRPVYLQGRGPQDLERVAYV